MCRVTMDHIKVTIGRLRVTLGHLGVTIGKHEANTTELHPKVRQTCLYLINTLGQRSPNFQPIFSESRNRVFTSSACGFTFGGLQTYTSSHCCLEASNSWYLSPKYCNMYRKFLLEYKFFALPSHPSIPTSNHAI